MIQFLLGITSFECNLGGVCGFYKYLKHRLDFMKKINKFLQ